jgi:Ribbon-helix-helix protein, copG family
MKKIIPKTTIDAKNSKLLAFKLDESLFEMVQSYALATGTSRSWVVRAALKRMLEELPAPAQNVTAPTRLLADDGFYNGMPD